jgi:hypothetical protein
MKWTAPVLAALLIAASTAQAKSISFGLNIGIPLNNLAAAEGGMVATTGRYTFGPAMQVDLPRGFSFDASLLYKQLGFGLASSPTRLTAHRLELPLLLRYDHHNNAPLHAFVHAGVSVNKVISIGGSSECEDTIAGKGIYCIEGKSAVQLRHKNTYGFVLGVGVDFRAGALRLAPELRITRWGDRNFGTQGSSLRSNLTQIELLLGFKH